MQSAVQAKLEATNKECIRDMDNAWGHFMLTTTGNVHFMYANLDETDESIFALRLVRRKINGIRVHGTRIPQLLTIDDILKFLILDPNWFQRNSNVPQQNTETRYKRHVQCFESGNAFSPGIVQFKCESLSVRETDSRWIKDFCAPFIGRCIALEYSARELQNIFWPLRTWTFSQKYATSSAFGVSCFATLPRPRIVTLYFSSLCVFLYRVNRTRLNLALPSCPSPK